MIDRITSIPDLTFDELSKRRGVILLDKEGIDCTGAPAADDMEALIASADNNVTFMLPKDGVITLERTITLSDRVGLIFASDNYPANNGYGPKFRWGGVGGGLGDDVNMFDVLACDHPQFRGVVFDIAQPILRSAIAVVNGTTEVTAADGNFTAADVGATAFITKTGAVDFATVIVSVTNSTTVQVLTAVPFTNTGCTLYLGKGLDGFLNFDGEPITHPGTLARAHGCTFTWGNGGHNTDFKAISISKTAASNHENYVFEDIDLFGVTQTATRSYDLGVTNSTDTVTASDGAFPLTDVGKRIRISHRDGIHDTTIVLRPNATTYVLASPVPFSDTECRIHVGQAHGGGIYNSTSQNSKHHTFTRIRGTFCSYVVRVVGGSFRLTTMQGYGNDVGVRAVGNAITETSHITDYANEADLRALEVTGQDVPIIITGTRLSVFNMRKDGFIQLGGYIVLRCTSQAWQFPSNAKIYSFVLATPLYLTTSDSKSNLPWADLGYDDINFAAGHRLISINDDDKHLLLRGLPKDPAVLVDGQFYNNGDDIVRIVGAPQHTTYTGNPDLAPSDSRTIEANSASAVNINVQPYSVRPFPVGARVRIVQTGSGAVTFVPQSGVTISSPSGSLKIASQYGEAFLRHRALNDWVLTGDLETWAPVTYTDSTTLALIDAYQTVQMNKATANSVTVPPNASVKFPVGARCDIVQIGAGLTSVVAGSGVTIEPSGALNSAGQWKAMSIYQRSINNWVLIGGVA